jgi:hypothetical protein
LKAKREYSRQVRVIGYCIIVFEVLTVFTWGAAFYGNIGTLATTATSALSPSSGNSLGATNTTAGVSLSIPIKGVGFFPVTVTGTAQFTNDQGQMVYQTQDSLTVSPGQTENFTVLIPKSITQSTSSLNSYTIKIDLEVSSLYGLVGMKTDVTVQPGKMGGNSS